MPPLFRGYDTPEIQHSKCKAELELGRVAKMLMSALLEIGGVQVFDSSEVDATMQHRPLVRVILPNGSSIGTIFINAGIARRWTPDYKANWC
ncbi:MAG: hypothetical protein JWQ89_2057 [Devosia sp.]|nr:hypothetical protein [Devosia sp.]